MHHPVTDAVGVHNIHLLQIYGHSVPLSAESVDQTALMLPLRGDRANMVDRYDVRTLLDDYELLRASYREPDGGHQGGGRKNKLREGAARLEASLDVIRYLDLPDQDEGAKTATKGSSTAIDDCLLRSVLAEVLSSPPALPGIEVMGEEQLSITHDTTSEANVPECSSNTMETSVHCVTEGDSGTSVLSSSALEIVGNRSRSRRRALRDISQKDKGSERRRHESRESQSHLPHNFSEDSHSTPSSSPRRRGRSSSGGLLPAIQRRSRKRRSDPLSSSDGQSPPNVTKKERYGCHYTEDEGGGRHQPSRRRRPSRRSHQKRRSRHHRSPSASDSYSSDEKSDSLSPVARSGRWRRRGLSSPSPSFSRMKDRRQHNAHRGDGHRIRVSDSTDDGHDISCGVDGRKKRSRVKDSEEAQERCHRAKKKRAKTNSPASRASRASVASVESPLVSPSASPALMTSRVGSCSPEQPELLNDTPMVESEPENGDSVGATQGEDATDAVERNTVEVEPLQQVAEGSGDEDESAPDDTQTNDPTRDRKCDASEGEPPGFATGGNMIPLGGIRLDDKESLETKEDEEFVPAFADQLLKASIPRYTNDPPWVWPCKEQYLIMEQCAAYSRLIGGQFEFRLRLAVDTQITGNDSQDGKIRRTAERMKFLNVDHPLHRLYLAMKAATHLTISSYSPSLIPPGLETYLVNLKSIKLKRTSITNPATAAQTQPPNTAQRDVVASRSPPSQKHTDQQGEVNGSGSNGKGDVLNHPVTRKGFNEPLLTGYGDDDEDEDAPVSFSLSAAFNQTRRAKSKRSATITRLAHMSMGKLLSRKSGSRKKGLSRCTSEKRYNPEKGTVESTEEAPSLSRSRNQTLAKDSETTEMAMEGGVTAQSATTSATTSGSLFSREQSPSLPPPVCWKAPTPELGLGEVS
eukprot:GHVN01060356.1.p1 GENE.GHVN01060356.1~~GHVN01060356.1.p1  ORF type:complete len:919 (+),score=152.13 GHVN01060356.1:115-2871(+)